MIIKLETSAAADTLRDARRDLEDLVATWGSAVTAAPPQPEVNGQSDTDRDKVIDPISLSAMLLSIPSTVLAAVDLADRIRKRRRAQQVIERAQQLAPQQVTMQLVADGRQVDVAGLGPDELLDLMADDARGQTA